MGCAVLVISGTAGVVLSEAGREWQACCGVVAGSGEGLGGAGLHLI